MTKRIRVDPEEARRAGVLDAPLVPLNAYQSDPAQEAAVYGRDGLTTMFSDMALIREFEEALDQVKRTGRYEGIACEYVGPAHLSIGQEAAAVGQSAALGVDDLIFGSHRSHGEVLAKSLSASRQLSAEALLAAMEDYRDGAVFKVVASLGGNDPVALAIDFALYGLLAEILGKDTGFNRGLGGSMHAFITPFGVMPNNAIVGGSAPIATGAALFKRINRRPGIVIANVGDSALGTGPVWEAMTLAAMDQYRTLWDPALGGNPPILFNFVNNFYGMGGQPEGETMGQGPIARAGLGINPDGMHAERVDGYNPLAVADAIRRKRAILEAGQGPVLLETIAYRISGHSTSDASAYRDAEELELWTAVDPLRTFGDYLIDNGHADRAELDEMRASAAERVVKIFEAAVSPALSPRAGPPTASIADVMFSTATAARCGDGEPDVLLPLGETRFAVTAAKHRFGLDDAGEPRSGRMAVTFAEALFEAMVHRFYEDPTMVGFGEENRDWGGAFGVYRGLTECLPYHRLFNTSISEAAIVGSGVGYAISGGRAVVELMYSDFIGRAGDEIFNQMAKWQAMSGGELAMPLVLRVSVGSKYGAQHSQDWSSMVAHVPGLRVFYPATPYDAKGMLALALIGTDPVVFFESQRLYPMVETLVPGGVPVDHYVVELGQPARRRTGDDLTLVTIGATLYRALEAAGELEERYGLSAEVIDARFLNPLDYTPILDSVRKTGRVVLAADAVERGSFLHTMATTIAGAAFDDLDAPVVVLGARNWIAPPADLEPEYFPQKEWIVDAIHERILPLPGHQTTTVQTDAEILRQRRTGV